MHKQYSPNNARYSLPALQIDSSSEQPAAMVASSAGKLENKILLNTGLSIKSTDSFNQISARLAYCLSDAVGLTVDFDKLSI